MGRVPLPAGFPPHRADRPQRGGADRLLRGATMPRSRCRDFVGGRRLSARRNTPASAGRTTRPDAHGAADAGPCHHRRPETRRTGRVVSARTDAPLRTPVTDILDLVAELRPARGDSQSEGSRTDRQRRHRLPSDARQRRRTGESPAPVPENDHRRHDPHAQKSLRPHAHGADRRLYGRYASGPPELVAAVTGFIEGL